SCFALSSAGYFYFYFLMTVGPRFFTYRRLLLLRTIINLAWDNIPFCHRKCAVIIWKKNM
ncbi:unnamed protein product, partial [Prunus brigantina]